MHKNCPVILTGSGFGLLAFGLLGTWYLFPKVINSQIHANIDLKEGTMGYDTWKKQPFPLKFKIVFFNVSNPNEVQQGAKPIVKEVGPYVYDEFRERIRIQPDEDKDVLKYVLKKYFYFNHKDSGHHHPDDVVTIVNAGLVGTALQVQLILPTAMSMVNDAVPYLFPNAKNIFLTAKVKDILFEGVRLYCQDPAVDFICGAMKGALPKTIQIAENKKDFLFSMFKHINGTDDGPWEMERGFKNTTRGEILSYEGEEIMDIWGGDTCNMINGSDSTVFELPTKIRQPLIHAYAQDFCRSIYIEYEKESEEFGIPTVRYTSTAGPFDYTSGDNKCFCPLLEDEDGEDHIVCPANGLADITPCMKAPVLISFPHFYLADPKLLDYVKGLNPKKELHENYANLEPRTATPLSGRKRVQVNIEVKKIDEFDLLENVTNGIFPILWVEEGVDLPEDFVKLLKSSFTKISILHSFKWVMIVFGLGMLIGGIVLILRKERMLCFASNDTVAITTIKSNKNRSGAADGGGAGQDNPAYESTQNEDNKNVINNNNNGNNGNNRQRIPMQQWNAQVWHTGEGNGN